MTAPRSSSATPFSLFTLVFSFAIGGSGFSFLPVWICLSLNQLHPVVSLLAAIVVAACQTLVLLSLRWQSVREILHDLLIGTREEAFGLSLASMVGFVGAFAIVFLSLSQLGPAQFRASSGAGFAEWVRFAFDVLVDTALLGIPSTYDLHFTHITPARFVARTVVLAYRLIIEMVLIVLVIRLVGFARQKGWGESSGPSSSN